MSDPISKLRGLTDEIKARETELRAYFTDLSVRLKEAAGGHKVYGVSQSCTLEKYGDDGASYGYLYFSEDDGFGVAYRTREEDMELMGDHPWEITYHSKTLEECSTVWLRVLSAPAVIESLFTDINTKVGKDLTDTKAGIQALATAVNLPLRDLDSGLMEAARKLNFGAVIQHWQARTTFLELPHRQSMFPAR